MNDQLDTSGVIRAMGIAVHARDVHQGSVLVGRDLVAMPARMTTMVARLPAQPAARDSSPRMTMSRDLVDRASKERA